MRIGLIEQVQEMIEAGTYDTDERLDVAVDRLLDDLGLTYEQAAQAAGFKSRQHWYNVEKGLAGGESGITLGTLKGRQGDKNT